MSPAPPDDYGYRLTSFNNSWSTVSNINTRFVDGDTEPHFTRQSGWRMRDYSSERPLRNRWEATPAGAARYFGHNNIAELIQNHRG